MVRGVGAFIEGAFGGYDFAQTMRERKNNRERTDRLDRLSEEQRAIDNRRNDLRDRIMQDEHSYNQGVRQRALEQDDLIRGATQAGVAATDADRADVSRPRLDPVEVTVAPVAPVAPTLAPQAAPGGGTASSGSAPTSSDGKAAPSTNKQGPAVRGVMQEATAQVDPQAALAAADELVRRAEESRDPATIQRAIAARDALRERLLGPSLAAPPEAASPPAASPLSIAPVDRREMEAMAQPSPADTRAALAAQQQALDARNAQPRQDRPVLTDPGPLRPAGGPRPPASVPTRPQEFIPSPDVIPSPAPTPRGTGMAFGETPAGAMPPAPRTTMGDIERRNDLVNPQAPATGPEQFIPGRDIIPPAFDPNAPLPMDNGGPAPGVTQEPVVNPMRAVGRPEPRGVPISDVMPPAAREQTREAAPAAADRLEETRTASGTLLADSMRARRDRQSISGETQGQPGPAPGQTRPQARPTEGGAALSAPPAPRGVTKAVPRQPREWAADFVETGVPVIEEQLIRAGRLDLAQEWRGWADSQVARDGYEAYARAGLAAARGDITGFADAIQTLYDSPYMPDGWETDRKASQFFTDEDGNIVGAQVVLRNSETGEMRVENYETIDELVSDLLMAVSPEAAFAAHMTRQQADRDIVLAAAADREADATATAEAIMSQLKVLEESRGGLAGDPTWAAMTPEQKVAEAAAIVRAAQGAAGVLPRGAAPAGGTAPGAAPGAVLPDWTDE